ncbi:hypothetical protein [Mycobacterium sp. OAE908]|uniref:hypothetical protein n=1 Tax=Mycobacterium sp. OAE908 TaxID=2817899 RepID=UPI001AE91F75
MQLALRPYVTTGIAIVGASVIAVAPIVPTPTDIHIANPVTAVDRAVQLTANEIEDAVNQLAYVGAQVLVSLAKLPAPVVAQILGVQPAVAEALLAGGALGLSGPLIGGLGAGGAAVQQVVDQLGSGDLAALINALIGAPATLIDGVVNGDFGPNVGPLLGIPAIVTVLVGGLINPGGLGLGGITLPGAIPTVQTLITELLGALGGGGMLAAAATPLAAPVQTEGQIEGAVNALLYNLVASPIVTIAGLLGQVLAPVLGEEQAALLPLAALGLFGPLISGPGAIGAATQDVVDSLGSGDIAGVLSSLIGAPATVIDGFINGGYGPDLGPLVSPVPLPYPFRAGGLINEGKLPLLSLPPWKLPGTFPTLQGLVTQILGLLPGASALTPLKTAAPAQTLSINSVDTSDKKLVTLDVAPVLGGKQAAPNADLTANVPADVELPKKAEAITSTIENTKPGPDLGKTVSEVAKPDTAHTPPAGPRSDTDSLDTTDGAKFIPEKTAHEAGTNKGNGSNPVGAAISSVAKSFAGAVKSALGG